MYKYIRYIYIYEKVCSSCHKGLVAVASQTIFYKLICASCLPRVSPGCLARLSPCRVFLNSKVNSWTCFCDTIHSWGYSDTSNHSSIINTMSIVFFLKESILFLDIGNLSGNWEMWIDVVVTNFLSELRKQFILKDVMQCCLTLCYSTLQVWNTVKPFV